MIKVLWIAADNDGDYAEFNRLPVVENLVLVKGAKFRWAPFLNVFGITLKAIKTATYVAEEDDERWGGAPIEKIGTFIPGQDHDAAWSRVLTKKRFYNERWSAEAKKWLPWETAEDEESVDDSAEEEITDEETAEEYEDTEAEEYEDEGEGEEEDAEDEPEDEEEPEPEPPARGRRPARAAAPARPARSTRTAAKPAAAKPAGSRTRGKPAAAASSSRGRKPAAAAASGRPARGKGRAPADNEPPF
jgi:hypothetical protein